MDFQSVPHQFLQSAGPAYPSDPPARPMSDKIGAAELGNAVNIDGPPHLQRLENFVEMTTNVVNDFHQAAKTQGVAVRDVHAYFDRLGDIYSRFLESDSGTAPPGVRDMARNLYGLAMREGMKELCNGMHELPPPASEAATPAANDSRFRQPLADQSLAGTDHSALPEELDNNRLDHWA